MLNPITGGDKTDAYKSFLSNVNGFRIINGLPTELKFGEDETAENFTSHRVSWHRSCHMKYSNQKLAKKEKSAEKRTPVTQLRSPQNVKLFYEKSATPAMIKHGMDIQRQTT